MERRAVWRPRPDDPKTVVGWLFQDVDTAVRYLGRYGKLSTNLVALSLVFRNDWFSAFVVFSLSSIPAYLDRPFWLRRRSLNAHVNGLVTLPAPETPFPCHVEIFKGDMLLGKDQGIVTFVDGWLYYEGLRTSFSLQRTAVSKRDDLRLELAEGGKIHFFPENNLAAAGTIEANLKPRFEANLASWMKSDAPSGQSLLPPATLHVSGRIRAWNQFVVASAALAVVSQFFLLGTSLFGHAALIAGAFLWGLVKSLQTLVRATGASRATRALEDRAPASVWERAKPHEESGPTQTIRPIE